MLTDWLGDQALTRARAAMNQYDAALRAGDLQGADACYRRACRFEDLRAWLLTDARARDLLRRRKAEAEQDARAARPAAEIAIGMGRE